MGFGKDGKGVIIRETRSQALGALSSSTGILIGSKLNTLERFRMLKSQISAVITSLTTGEGIALDLYLVDGAFSLADFELSIENNGPLGPNDTEEEETSERFSIYAGSTPDPIAETETIVQNFHGGAMMELMPRWTFSRTKSWNWILYNNGVALTTGASIKIKAKDFGVWVL